MRPCTPFPSPRLAMLAVPLPAGEEPEVKPKNYLHFAKDMKTKRHKDMKTLCQEEQTGETKPVVGDP